MEADIVKCYKPLLHDEDIKESFHAIVQRSRKFAKPVSCYLFLCGCIFLCGTASFTLFYLRMLGTEGSPRRMGRSTCRLFAG
jgi:hypothetical protein